jgi:hypothetical protein
MNQDHTEHHSLTTHTPHHSSLATSNLAQPHTTIQTARHSLLTPHVFGAEAKHHVRALPPLYQATASLPTHHTIASLSISIGVEPHTKTQPRNRHTTASLRTSYGAELHTTPQPQYPHLMEHSRLIINIIKPFLIPHPLQPAHLALPPFPPTLNIPTAHSFLSLSSHLFLNPT